MHGEYRKINRGLEVASLLSAVTGSGNFSWRHQTLDSEREPPKPVAIAGELDGKFIPVSPLDGSSLSLKATTQSSTVSIRTVPMSPHPRPGGACSGVAGRRRDDGGAT
ncbi:hypothetical protein Ancab_003191 [Ancistrocladus abbreviatus]